MSAPIITPRTTTVTLYQGDDRTKIADALDLVEELRATEGAPSRVGDSAAYTAAAAEHDALVRDAEGRKVVVVLQALPRRRWRELTESCPPRPDHEGDKLAAVNEAAFADLLVPESITEPKFTLDADREAFLDSLSDADFSRLYFAAYVLNRGSEPAPKALLDSAPTPSSDAT